MDCVMCGEYFAQDKMTEIKGDQWCCEECYEENGCECWKCGEKIVEDIENEEVDCYTHTYYLENCDDGDCCATCMEEIVEEHKDQEKDEIKAELAREDDEIECVHYLYLCDECDFMTGKDDPDCSNCGATHCMMAKCVE